MRVLVIENHPTAPVGLFGQYLRDVHAAELHQVSPASLPGSTAGFDLVVSLGSPDAAYDPYPWVAQQQALLRQAVADGQRVIGICFGAQMLAAAMGGQVAPMGRRRAGWMENEDSSDPVWRGPWLRWHGDHLTAPPGAEVLARSDDTVQVFRIGSAVGVQFHPEADAVIAARWADSGPDWLVENGSNPAALREQTAAQMQDAAAARRALFDTMLAATIPT